MKSSRPLGTTILDALEQTPGQTDRELTNVIKGPGVHPSQINQECRLLEGSGLLVRRPRADGRIANFVAGTDFPEPPPVTLMAPADGLSEDEVKRHLVRWLEADGWTVLVAWGKARGIDIAARRGKDSWIIEAKGCGSLQPMRVNYFLAILGETLQRMNDPSARYSIALPDLPQFRGLWIRLPTLAKMRTGITVLFVSSTGQITHDSGAAGTTDVPA